MKLISSPAYANGRLAGRGTAIYLMGCLLAAALFSTGCHKASETSTDTVPPAAPAAAATDTNQGAPAVATSSDTIQNPNPATPMADPSAVSPSNPNVAPLAKPNGEPDLTALDTALAGWVFGHRRMPSNFAEFAASAGQPVPRPPPGKKYVITQSMHIQLVNQ